MDRTSHRVAARPLRASELKEWSSKLQRTKRFRCFLSQSTGGHEAAWMKRDAIKDGADESPDAPDEVGNQWLSSPHPPVDLSRLTPWLDYRKICIEENKLEVERQKIVVEREKIAHPFKILYRLAPLFAPLGVVTGAVLTLLATRLYGNIEGNSTDIKTLSDTMQDQVSGLAARLDDLARRQDNLQTARLGTAPSRTTQPTPWLSSNINVKKVTVTAANNPGFAELTAQKVCEDAATAHAKNNNATALNIRYEFIGKPEVDNDRGPPLDRWRRATLTMVVRCRAEMLQG